MGLLSKIWKKVKKTAKKPLSKVFRGVAKGIAKVGKAVMKGVNYMNRKLGPLGSIALAMAMPYALSGLSSLTTGLQATQGTGAWSTFLRSAGQVGNRIRLGYQHTTGTIGSVFNSITKSISQTFQTFAGKGTKVGNIWTKISKGAKNLYKSAQQNFAKSFGKQGMGGSVDIKGVIAKGPASWNNTLVNQSMTTSQAAEAFSKGLIDGSQLTGQSLGTKSGWWTQELSKSQLSNQKLITNTINDAWNQNNILSPNALKYKNDLSNYAKDIGSYINDEQIGNVMTNGGVKSKDLINSIGGENNYLDFDITKSKDYAYNAGTKTYTFDGKNSFNSKIAKDSFKNKAKKLAFGKIDSLLNAEVPKHDVVYEVDSGSQNLYADTKTNYDASQIIGSSGGTLFAQVFGDKNANDIMQSYKNMNILAG
jgi:hypothetical protein